MIDYHLHVTVNENERVIVLSEVQENHNKITCILLMQLRFFTHSFSFNDYLISCIRFIMSVT
jgi:hypothetical protein